MMTDLSVTVPDDLVKVAGSIEAARNLLVTAGITELVRRGLVSSDIAQEWLGEMPDDWLRLAEHGGAFDFWNDPDEDIYTLQHGEPV
jgi:hypothetical protein